MAYVLPTTYYLNQKSPPNQRVTSFDIIWPQGQYKIRHALLICTFVQLQTCLLDNIRSQLIQLNLCRIHPFIICVRFVSSFGKMVTAMCRSGLTWPWHFTSGFNSSLVHPWSTNKVRWNAWLLRSCNVFLVDGWHLIPGNIRKCLMKWIVTQVRSN